MKREYVVEDAKLFMYKGDKYVKLSFIPKHRIFADAHQGVHCSVQIVPWEFENWTEEDWKHTINSEGGVIAEIITVDDLPPFKLKDSSVERTSMEVFIMYDEELDLMISNPRDEALHIIANNAFGSF